MRSVIFPWLAGLVVALSGGLLLSLPFAFALKLSIACLTVFLTDALGGRWFGYASLLALAAGLRHDSAGEWALMLPVLAASAVAALTVRHSERTWFGVILAMLAFMLPVVALRALSPRFDPELRLPLGARYLVLHALVGSFSILVSSLLTWQQLSRPVQARVTRAPRVTRIEAKREAPQEGSSG